MKITKLSLAAIAAMTITTGAMAEGWDYNGQAVAYTQTVDQSGNGDLFGSDSTYGAVGLQLGAVNKNLFNGIGAGVEVSGIHNDDGQAGGFYGGGGNAGTTSGGLTQAYLTYGAGNSSFKLGRQQLPKSLSPFAYTEGWQMFKNSFDAALAVNTDIEKTTLAYAFVKNSNRSVGAYANEDSFTDPAVGAMTEGAHMIAASTKAIPNVTLTGTAYQASNVAGTRYGDTNIVWLDAKTKMGPVGIALQGGQISPDNTDKTKAFGVKVSGKVAMFNLSAAHTRVSEGNGLGISNLGTGIKSPLYTQMVLNNVGNYHANTGSDFTKLFATTKAGGGTVKLGYGLGTNSTAGNNRDYSELDLMYVKKLTANTKVFAAYVRTNDDDATSTLNDNNFVRVWGRYSF